MKKKTDYKDNRITPDTNGYLYLTTILFHYCESKLFTVHKTAEYSLEYQSGWLTLI